MRFILYLCLSLISTHVYPQLIINEFSNGTSGSKEYYELLTVGPAGTTVDIRGWIVDDHSGFYGCSSGNGIAQGHIRFAFHSNWQCVPVGSLIVIYNPSDKNSAITQNDDYTDSNKDGVYILPINAASYLEADLNLPSSASCNNFIGTYTTAINWQPLALGNAADVAQLIDPANTSIPHHAIGYGSLSGPNPPIYFSGNGGSTNYSFVNTISNNWSLQSNWTSQNATNDSPGLPNNTQNAAWINALKLNISASVYQGCAPLNVQFNSNVDTTSNFSFQWNFGNSNTANTSNSSFTFTTQGVYSVVFTVSNALGCSISDTLQINVQNSTTPTAPNLPDLCSNVDSFQLPLNINSNFNWSGLFVVNNVFYPNLAGAGNHQITYSDTGACAGSIQTSIVVKIAPNVTFSLMDTVFCENDNPYTLTSGLPTGGNYSGNGTTNAVFYPNLAGSGFHSLNYVFTNNQGCSDSALQNVSVVPTPTIQFSLPDTVCINQTLLQLPTASPLGGDFYFLGTKLQNTTIALAPLQSGNYYYLSYEVNELGCKSIDSVSFYLDDEPTISLPFGDTVICVGSSFTLNAQTNYTISWHNQIANSFLIDKAGLITASAQNFCGSKSKSVRVELDSSTVNIGFESNKQGKFTFHSLPNNFVDYSWIVNNEKQYSTEKITHQFTQGGSASVVLRVINSLGCVLEERILVEVPFTNQLFIPNVFTPNGDGLNDVFYVIGEFDASFYAEVYNRWGNKVASWNSIFDGWDGSHKGQACQDGVYILKINYMGETYIRSLTLINKN